MEKDEITRRFNKLTEMRRAYMRELEYLHDELKDETDLDEVPAIANAIEASENAEAELWQAEKDLHKIVLKDFQT